MHPALNLDLFLVKEHVGLFKAANNFDVYDPETGRLVLECREEKLGILTKLLRFSEYKRMTPFHIEVRAPGGEVLVQVKRGISIFLSRVQVLDGRGRVLGSFKQKLFSLGGAFDVLDTNDDVICTLKGNWIGWDFSFASEGVELARVTKKWAGLGKELLTTADNYMLSMTRSVPRDSPARALILAAVFCIDMVLKE